jgi:flagellar hook-basal body complex protein FliE
MSPTPIIGVQATAATGYLPDAGRVPPSTDGSGFGAALAGAINNAQALSSDANALAVQAVTGNLDDIHNATIAATRAQVTLELVAAVRNKGVDAFNEIMRMQA